MGVPRLMLVLLAAGALPLIGLVVWFTWIDMLSVVVAPLALIWLALRMVRWWRRPPSDDAARAPHVPTCAPPGSR
jgi:membrane protein implicated in regulation of membrane protease activity